MLHFKRFILILHQLWNGSFLLWKQGSSDVNIAERKQPAAQFCLVLYTCRTSSLNKIPGMFSSLKKRWKVGTKELTLILCVFTITGFTTAWLSRSVTVWAGFDEGTHWSAKLLLRLAVLLFGYQIILLFVAFLLGQFAFFWKFEKKFLQRIGFIKRKNASSNH